MIDPAGSDSLYPYLPDIHIKLVEDGGEWFCRYKENDIYVFPSTGKIRRIKQAIHSEIFRYTVGDTLRMRDPEYYKGHASLKRREGHTPACMTIEMVEAMTEWAGDEMIFIKPGAKAKYAFKERWFDSDYLPKCHACSDSKLDFTKSNPRPCPSCSA